MNIFSSDITTINMESDSMRVLCLQGDRVKTYRETDLPLHYITQGVIEKPQEVAKLLSGLIKDAKLSKRNVIASMNCFRSITRFITLPKLRGRKLKEAVKWAAEREMPVPLDTMNIWWKVMQKTDDEQQVLIVSVPRDALAALYTTLFYAGITPKAIDMKAIALSRIVTDNRAIIADIEHDTISIILKSGGIPVMMRNMAVNAGTTEIEDIASRLNDELSRIIGFYNADNPRNRIGTDCPLYLVGGSNSGKFSAVFKENYGRTVLAPDTDLSYPEGFSVSRYAVNIGLYFREVKQRRSPLYPDMSKAARFKV